MSGDKPVIIGIDLARGPDTISYFMGLKKARHLTAAEIKAEFGIDVGEAHKPHDTFVMQAPQGVTQIDVGAALFPKPRNRHEKRKMAKMGER